MKIVRLETFQVPPRWLFLKVSTDDGPCGWGEPVVEGRLDSSEAAVHELGKRLVGRDPLHLEDIWQENTRAGFYRGGPVLASAVAGIDQALWDIAGKAHGVPVHELLGGPVRDRVRVYAWIGGDVPSALAESAARRIEQGFSAVKMNVGGATTSTSALRTTSEIVDRVGAVRAAIGPDRDVAVDFHGRLDLGTARRVIPLLAPLAPLFVEEPVVPELAPHQLRALTTLTTVPIALGERVFSRQEFLPLLLDGLGVAQPDLSHAGGISEGRRIASLAETFGVPLAPHSPLGPIALAASLQLDLAVPNFLVQEVSLGMHYNHEADLWDYLVDAGPLTPVDGWIERWRAPGLGIEVDEAAVRRAAAHAVTWEVPRWRHADGSLAEW